MPGLEKAFVLWEMAAAVTLQKYLSDITRTLRRIEFATKDVLGRMDDEVYGKLRQNAEVVFRVARELQSARFAPHELAAYMVQLDMIERESGQIAKSCDQEAQRSVHELKSVGDQSAGWTEREDRALERLLNGSRAEHRTALALFTASAAAHLRAVMSGSPKTLHHRLKTYEEHLVTLRALHSEFQNACSTRLDQVKGPFYAKAETEGVYRDRFRFASQLCLSEVTHAHETLDGYIAQLRSALIDDSGSAQPAILRVTISDDGAVESCVGVLPSWSDTGRWSGDG